jgi:excisionase family DNA binding protein
VTEATGDRFVRELARALTTSMDENDLRNLAVRLRPHLADYPSDVEQARLMTAAEVAERARVHVETVRRAIRAGQLPIAARIGRCPRLAPLAVDSWLEQTSGVSPDRVVRKRRAPRSARLPSEYSLRAALDIGD